MASLPDWVSNNLVADPIANRDYWHSREGAMRYMVVWFTYDHRGVVVDHERQFANKTDAAVLAINLKSMGVSRCDISIYALECDS